MKKIFYVKSIRAEFDWLQTLIDKENITTQSTKNIFETSEIRPNTSSFHRPLRLCTTILDKHYTKTYRPQWLIFEVDEDYKPDYIFPFNLSVITENNDPVAEYHAIKDELHSHYNVHLIEDYMNFASISYHEMLEKFKDDDWEINPDHILHLVNDFRISKWRTPLSKDTQKLVEYNEAIFLRPVKISIIAIYGDQENLHYQAIAKKYNVPHYSSAKDFYESIDK